MSTIEIQLPKLGESIHSATIVQWLKKEGDMIALDEAIVEVSTDKVNSEIPSPVAGIVEKILIPLDAEVLVGEAIAIIRTDGSIPAPLETEAPSITSQETTQTCKAQSGFFSPAVLQKAQQEGISFSELEGITGTGAQGRITRQDLDRYVESKRKTQHSPLLSSSSTHSVVKLTPLRKAIAQSTIRSNTEIPSAAVIQEIDVELLMRYIQENKDAFLAQHEAKLTLTTFFAKALTEMVIDFPLLNASWHDDHIQVRHGVHLGLAVSVDDGVAIPVLKHCERKTLAEIAKEISQIAKKTRTHALTAEDMQGATLTLTNIGMTGMRAGIPIVPIGQVAILCTGAVQKRVLVVDDDKIAIRHAVDITLCFDHRVLDGVYACEAIKRLQKLLESYTTQNA